MVRPLRIEYPGAIYEITVRGNAGDAIFKQDEDRVSFLKNFGSVCKRFNWDCYAYCLLDSEYQLLIKTHDANLSRGMREVNGIYTQAMNRKYQQRGHILEGRYQAIVLQKDPYLAKIHRKIVLLPVHHRLVETPLDWNWSNYRGMMGKDWTASWLKWKDFFHSFAAHTGEARRKYAEYISENHFKQRFYKPRARIILGSESFIEEVQTLTIDNHPVNDIIKQQRNFKSLAQYKHQENSRNEAIKAAFASGSFTLKQIGDYFKLHYTTVSRIAREPVS